MAAVTSLNKLLGVWWAESTHDLLNAFRGVCNAA